ncbi:MAG: hypothetical protein ABH856_01170 [Patescibacteria group bacterium]|nr:hypothetical protein [Patescibacteria group bacterium]
MKLENTKLGIIALMLAMLTVFGVTPVSGAFEVNDEMDVFELATAYHESVNELFNAKAKKLITEDETANKESLDEEECLKTDNNVSTFCVAVQAIDLYEQYKDELYKRWDPTQKDIENSESLTDALSNTSSKRDFIKEQVAKSKVALDMTLSAYNELRWSFELHKQYKQVIKDLLKYRDKLADVRQYVEQYPARFADATTPYCQ